jgi:hypothetical protein
MIRNADRRTRSGPALALLLLLGLLVGYPLSAGPVCLLYVLCNASDEPLLLDPALEAIYGPLGALPDPILEPLDAWVELWINLAP